MNAPSGGTKLTEDFEIVRKPLALMAAVLTDEACLDALAALDRIEIMCQLLREERRDG